MSTNRRCLPSGRVCGCASSSSPVYMVCFWEVHDEADTASTPLGTQVLPFFAQKNWVAYSYSIFALYALLQTKNKFGFYSAAG